MRVLYASSSPGRGIDTIRPREVPLVRGWYPASSALCRSARSAALNTGILGEGWSAGDDRDLIDVIPFP
jgi:hypothetical protein